MTPEQFSELLAYIKENNCWGIGMGECIRRKHKCVKYVSSTFDSRDGKVYAVRFNLGSKEWIDFRVESPEDLRAIYDWLDEEVK